MPVPPTVKYQRAHHDEQVARCQVPVAKPPVKEEEQGEKDQEFNGIEQHGL
jgi:hypothetical protein